MHFQKTLVHCKMSLWKHFIFTSNVFWITNNSNRKNIMDYRLILDLRKTLNFHIDYTNCKIRSLKEILILIALNILITHSWQKRRYKFSEKFRQAARHRQFLNFLHILYANLVAFNLLSVNTLLVELVELLNFQQSTLRKPVSCFHDFV